MTHPRVYGPLCLGALLSAITTRSLVAILVAVILVSFAREVIRAAESMRFGWRHEMAHQRGQQVSE